MSYDENGDYKMDYDENERYDLGKWLYGVDNSKIMPEGPEVKSKIDKVKKQVLSPVGLYLTVLIVFLFVWFLRTLVLMIRANDPVILIGWLTSSLFTLFVCELILIFSVFGLWGKFASWAVRKGAVSGSASEVRRMVSQAERAASSIGRENTFTLYENYIVIKNEGRSRYIRRHSLKELMLLKDKYQESYNVIIILTDDKVVNVNAVIPIEDAYILPDFLGNAVQIIDVSERKKQKKEMTRNKAEVKRESKYDDAYFDNIVSNKVGYFDSDRIGGLVMGFIAIAGGIGVILMHFYVSDEIPWFLGAFFIFGGTLAEFSVFNAFPIVTIFIIPFLFAVMFTVFPLGICILLYNVEGVDFMSLWQFIEIFSPVTCVVVMMTAMGLLFLAYTIIRLVKYIQYKRGHNSKV